MSGLEEAFNPGALQAIRQMAAEKILPAPSPVAGDKPLTDADGAEVWIPPIESGHDLPDPPRRGA
ncbi:hypothetical protein [Demequina sp.]|uniref:hypothetical protein n=1 Tax=Demequina sp. TaxID=2050685 RepID=UPI003A8828B2